jgi:hypothetical protein
MSPSISYDQRRQTATFSGPGGFTEVAMDEDTASHVAMVLGVVLKVRSGR